MNFNRNRTLVVLGIYLVVGVAIYGAGLNGPYYGDDFKFVFDQPSTKVFDSFLHANPNTPFYRPIESMVLAVIQASFGTSTLPIHLLVLFCHVLLACLIYHATVELGFSKLQGSLAGLFMLASQANALAVLSNDALSQVAGTLFGFCSLWALYRSRNFDKRKLSLPAAVGVYSYVGSVVFFALSLWMKETSLSFLLALIIMTLVLAPRHNPSTVRKGMIALLPYVFIAAMYFLIRTRAVSGQVDDRYTLSLGVNVLVNSALTLYSAFLPTSSVSLFSAFANGRILLVVATTAIAVVLLAITIIGVVRSNTSPVSILLIVLTLINMFPMALFKHVSELYAYNSMPAISILFGIGVATLAEQFMRGTPGRVASIVMLVLFFASQVVSIQQKAHLMTENGQRASLLLRQIIPHLQSVPANGTLVLLNPDDQRIEYSVFLMKGFNVLRYGTNIIGNLSKRTDIGIWIVNERERVKFSIPSGAFVLSLVGDEVRPMPGISPN